MYYLYWPPKLLIELKCYKYVFDDDKYFKYKVELECILSVDILYELTFRGFD